MRNERITCLKQVTFIDSKFMPFNFVIVTFAVVSFASKSTG